MSREAAPEAAERRLRPELPQPNGAAAFTEPPFAEPPFAEPPFAEPPFAEPPFAA